MTGEDTSTGVRRRTVLKGAAWSVPVAAVAVAVPARAASGCVDCEDYAITQTLEKETGAWQYKDTIAITHCGDPVSVQGAVVLVKFDDPDEVKTTTDAHNCSPSYDPATATLTVTGNADATFMDFAVSFNTQGASDRDITGNVTVLVPGCTDPVIVAQPFVFHAIKQ
ncbi:MULTISPECIES: hypothetical protein [unclassified Microbacterium]|uniref:hypothetical protein n=1 Tax=unclassified Microbacterium TaxID=2609290 RepID=UPI0012FBB166|nr:hypothetical protein [Microbacterium sp. MAH-37]MVQ40779.1 hypothetical protein [Microbacterium sp. MAH-37]